MPDTEPDWYHRAKNDEARMSNDEEARNLNKNISITIHHLIIRHSFELRHSDFVIRYQSRVCTSTDSTAGRSRTMGFQLSHASADA
jgi:hypothetical protein